MAEGKERERERGEGWEGATLGPVWWVTHSPVWGSPPPSLSLHLPLPHPPDRTMDRTRGKPPP